jgi:glycosyltransferase involved in cell wall biosynthesis
MRARICIVTTAQPTTNPRVVKEADALSAAGCDVQVVGAFAGSFAMESDPALLARRRWALDLVDWRPEHDRRLYWTSGVRHRLASRLGGWQGSPMAIVNAAASRPTPELTTRALAHPADLYIAHTLGALPAAAAAARRHRAVWGFDAEDFHSGQFAIGSADPMRRVAERVERHYLPHCAYLTAASPGIAEVYRPLVGGRGPRCVLNVSSLADRQAMPRRDATDAHAPVRLYWFSQTIGPDRGLEDVVRAMGRLPEQAVELHVRGTWADGYETTLRQLASACDLAPDRVVAHSAAPADAMVRVAAPHDVGLALEPGSTPNSQLAISNKLLTYLMAGLAVVASRTSGQQWVIDRAPGAGWTYTPGDVAQLASVLSAHVMHPVARQAAREAAAAAAETRFCWEYEQAALLDEIGGVLEGRPGNVARGARAELAAASDRRAG